MNRNQLAGFDFKFKLEPTLGWPISFYGQMIGEDESGFLPSANMYLGGIEGHHGWGKDAVNWYFEAHDTRSNMSRTITVIPITFIKMVITSKAIL